MGALVLDFDGTMVDTEWPSFLAWRAIFERFNARLTLQEWVACVGSGTGFDPFAHLSSQLPDHTLDRDTILAARMADKIRRIGDAPLLPGVMAWIEEAEAMGWPIAVASSSPADWVHGHLTRLGIHHRIAAIRTRDDVTHTKPDPALFYAAAAALAVPPTQCIACEDSLHGVRAARAAGMFTIAIPNRVTAQLDLSEANLVIPTLEGRSLRHIHRMHIA